MRFQGKNVSDIVLKDNFIIKKVHEDFKYIYDNLLYEYLIGIRLNHQPHFVISHKINEVVDEKLLKYDKASKVYSLQIIPTELYLEYFDGIPLAQKITSMSYYQLQKFIISFISFLQKNLYFRHNDIHWYNILINDNTFKIIDYARSDILGILQYDLPNKKDDIVSIIEMLIDCLNSIFCPNKILILKKKRQLYQLRKSLPKKSHYDLLQEIRYIIE